jgi:hypothetical protein
LFARELRIIFVCIIQFKLLDIAGVARFMSIWGLVYPGDFLNFRDFENIWPMIRTYFSFFCNTKAIKCPPPPFTLSTLSTLSPSEYPAVCLQIIQNIISPVYSVDMMQGKFGRGGRGGGGGEEEREKTASVGKKLLRTEYVDVIAAYFMEISSLAMKEVTCSSSLTLFLTFSFSFSLLWI